MEIHNVVLDADWFVHGDERLIKQFCFHDCFTGAEHLFVFEFPRSFKKHASSFDKQSSFSHRIPWNKKGFYSLGDVCCVLSTIRYILEVEESQINFWAKGEEKCRILSYHGIIVRNLETLDCPKFSELSALFPTTANKARVFAKWLKGRICPTPKIQATPSPHRSKSI